MKTTFLFAFLTFLLISGQATAQSDRFDAVYTTQVKKRNEKNAKVLNDLQVALKKELEKAKRTQAISDTLLNKEHSEFRDCLPIYKYRLSQYAGIEMRIRLKLKRYNLMNDVANLLYAENALAALRKECTTPKRQLPSDLMWEKVKYRFEKYKAILGRGNGNFYLESASKAAKDGNTSEAARLLSIYGTGQTIGDGSNKPGDYKGLTGENHFLLNEWTLYYYQSAFEAIEKNMDYINKCYIPSADRLEMYNQQMEDCEELYSEIKKAFYLNNIEKMHITQEDIKNAMEKRFKTKGIE